jgi:hypothetical protein
VTVLKLEVRTKAEALVCLPLAPGEFASAMAPGLVWKLLPAWDTPTGMGEYNYWLLSVERVCHLDVLSWCFFPLMFEFLKQIFK